MAERKYKIQYYKDYTFFFKYEINTDNMLHIWVRHRTEPKNAIRTFIEGKSIWNEENNRFETFNQTHTIYWFWLDEENKKVMVITCFNN